MSLFAAAHEVVTTAAGGVVIPNPAPAVPTGLAGPANIALAWMKGVAVAFAAGSLIFCGIKIMAGRHGRSNTGAEGVTGLGWVIAGLTVIAVSAGIVGVFA